MLSRLDQMSVVCERAHLCRPRQAGSRPTQDGRGGLWWSEAAGGGDQQLGRPEFLNNALDKSSILNATL